MNTLEVNNEIELGNAIWTSEMGDTIILKSGEYGNIPIKNGVNYEFEDNATAAAILGLGIAPNSQWSASLISFENTSIKKPKISQKNIKLYYIFQKTLPFNTRFEHPIAFVHANGVIINVLGNNKDEFTLGVGAGNAENQLPKGVVNIIVPILEEFDINKASNNHLNSLLTGSLSKEDKIKEIDAHQNEVVRQKEIEKIDLNFPLGLGLNEFEYKALWSLNSFIREYSKNTNGKKIKGFSTSEFKDDLQFVAVNNLNEGAPFNSSSYIESFQNQKLDNAVVKKLSASFLSSQEFSFSEFTEYHLNHLNYSFATLGMYQEFESLWESYSPDKQDKWGFIEHYITDTCVKGDLAEMINARNNIVHDKKLKVDDNPPRNKLKLEWGSKPLNEYEIYAYKKPFFWNKALRILKECI